MSRTPNPAPKPAPTPGAPSTSPSSAPCPWSSSPSCASSASHESALGDVTAHVGTLGDRTVVGHRHRHGHRAGHRGATGLLDAVHVERVVVVGITGAVENETPIGTLVLPEIVVNGATGDEYRPAPLGEGTPAGAMWTTDTLQHRPGPHRPPAGPRRGVARHGDRRHRGAVRTTRHPVVGVPGHQRPRHRRERRRRGVPALATWTGRPTTRPSSATSPSTPNASRPWPGWPRARCSATEAAADAAIAAHCATLG